MASPIHNDSKNVTISGLEIVTYTNVQGEHSPIVIRLTKIRQSAPQSQSSDEAPISFQLPKDCLFDQQMTLQEEQSRSVHTRPITFELPEDCVDYIIKKHEEEEQAGSGITRLSLSDRLKGWIIEKRKRPDSERFDKFYHHKISKRMFRSFSDVARFIIYGVHPQSKYTVNKDSIFEKQRFNASSKLKEQKWSSSHSALVEELLEEARNNLLNIFDTQMEDVCSAYDEGPTAQTVEELLVQARNNLHCFDDDCEEQPPQE